MSSKHGVIQTHAKTSGSASVARTAEGRFDEDFYVLEGELVSGGAGHPAHLSRLTERKGWL